MIFYYKRRIFGFECDIYGHLNNANYLHFFEEARTFALEETNYSVEKMLEIGYQIFVRKIELEYLKALQYNKEYTIKSSIKSCSRIKSHWVQEIISEDGQLFAKLDIYAVFAKNGQASRLTKEIYEHYSTFIEKD